MAIILQDKLNELVTARFTAAQVNSLNGNAFLAISIGASIGGDTDLWGVEYGVLCAVKADLARIFTIAQVARNHSVDPDGSFFQVDAFAASKSLAYYRLRSDPPFDHGENWQVKPVPLKAGASYAIMFIARVTDIAIPVTGDVLLYLMGRGEIGVGAGKGPHLRTV